jgi:hypothetical protein
VLEFAPTTDREQLRQDDADELHLHPELFPMQNGPGIPWSTAEAIYKAYREVFGTSQTLEGIAGRGGFGWSEVEAIRVFYQRKFGKLPEGWR